MSEYMTVNVDVPDALAEVLWQEHLQRLEKESDRWEKAKLSIHSKEDIVRADLVVIAQFFVDKKLVFNEEKFS